MHARTHARTHTIRPPTTDSECAPTGPRHTFPARGPVTPVSARVRYPCARACVCACVRCAHRQGSRQTRGHRSLRASIRPSPGSLHSTAPAHSVCAHALARCSPATQWLASPAPECCGAPPRETPHSSRRPPARSAPLHAAALPRHVSPLPSSWVVCCTMLTTWPRGGHRQR